MFKSNLFIGIVLLAYSGSAIAIGSGAPAQPVWWVSMLLSAALLVVSGYIKGVKDDTKKLREDVQAIQVAMYRDFHSKIDVEKQFVELKALINSALRERRE